MDEPQKSNRRDLILAYWILAYRELIDGIGRSEPDGILTMDNEHVARCPMSPHAKRTERARLLHKRERAEWRRQARGCG